MRLADIMTSPLLTIAPTATIDDALSTMRLRGVHHLAVAAHGELVGMVSERDINGAPGPTVADVMRSPVVTADAHATLREAANLMRGRAVGSLPVTLRGKPAGIVTIADLLELVGRGAERPVVRGKRWTLRHRGPRQKAHVPR
jgi:acetoin utilization protein AcuB